MNNYTRGTMAKVFTTILMLTFVQTAYSQIYKCKNAKGKITYSESECPLNSKGDVLTLEPNVIDSSDLRRQITNRKNLQANITQDSTGTESPELMTPYQLETRIRELNVDLTDNIAFEEKRTDARNELGYLKRTSPKSLSYELEQKRRNTKVDLNDFDRAKRRKALTELVSIYAYY